MRSRCSSSAWSCRLRLAASALISAAVCFGASACDCCSSTDLLSHPRDMNSFYAADDESNIDLREGSILPYIQKISENAMLACPVTRFGLEHLEIRELPIPQTTSGAVL